MSKRKSRLASDAAEKELQGKPIDYPARLLETPNFRAGEPKFRLRRRPVVDPNAAVSMAERFAAERDEARAELQEARDQRDEAEAEARAQLEDTEEARDERDAARADLAEARAQVATLRAALNRLLSGMIRTHGDEHDGETLYSVRITDVANASAALAETAPKEGT